MQLDYVSADAGSVFLVNCDVAIGNASPRILAGLAFVQGGLPEWVAVYGPDGRSLGEIKLSESCRRNNTAAVLYSKNDDLEFELKPSL